jgi:hypothetical protein
MGDKLFLGGVITVVLSCFLFLGWCIFAGAPTMICKDGKVFIKEMGHDIYRASPNTAPCFNSQELLK